MMIGQPMEDWAKYLKILVLIQILCQIQNVELISGGNQSLFLLVTYYYDRLSPTISQVDEDGAGRPAR